MENEKYEYILFADGTLVHKPKFTIVDEPNIGYFTGSKVSVFRSFGKMISAPGISQSRHNIIPLTTDGGNADIHFCLQEFRTGKPLLNPIFLNNISSTIKNLQNQIRVKQSIIDQLTGVLTEIETTGLLPMDSILGQKARQLQTIIGTGDPFEALAKAAGGFKSKSFQKK